MNSKKRRVNLSVGKAWENYTFLICEDLNFSAFKVSGEGEISSFCHKKLNPHDLRFHRRDDVRESDIKEAVVKCGEFPKGAQYKPSFQFQTREFISLETYGTRLSLEFIERGFRKYLKSISNNYGSNYYHKFIPSVEKIKIDKDSLERLAFSIRNR